MSVALQTAQEAQTSAGYDGKSVPGSATDTFHAKPLPVEFTASGSEYFRIWIVNLLLTLVTLGLYFPWAKVRRLRYFYSNTLIDSHPLHFHGDPRQMFKGFLLVVVGFILYSVAGRFSPIAALGAFIIVALLWPALARLSMRFRMRNTSWRGLRFSFLGSTGAAYAAWIPVFIPSAGFLILALLAPELLDPDPTRHASKAIQVTFGALFFCSFVFFPWASFRLKAYQHQNYCYGRETSAFTAKVKDYYWISVKSLAVILLAFIALLSVIFIVVFGLQGFQKDFSELAGNRAAVFVFTFIGLIAGSFFISLLQPYFVTRFQNLIWNKTHTQSVQFSSALPLWPMFKLTFKNWVLIVLTLGLYWPFAHVAMTRLRLEAVALQFNEDPALWTAAAPQAPGTAIGDLSSDFFDFDVGL